MMGGLQSPKGLLCHLSQRNHNCLKHSKTETSDCCYLVLINEHEHVLKDQGFSNYFKQLVSGFSVSTFMGSSDGCGNCWFLEAVV